MTSHVSLERINDAVDGMLSSAEMAEIERHVESCGPCRNEYARLSEVVGAVRALPRAGRVPADAWTGIAERVAGTTRDEASGEPEDAKVLPIRSGSDRSDGSGASGAGRRWSLSSAQLAAAAALVALVSATTVWIAIEGPGTPVVESASATAPGGAAARAVSLEGGRYGEAVQELQEVLATGRSVLTPETLATIETSLNTVDAAIAEVEAALANDPNSDLLLRMLSNHRRTKLGVLQRAVAAVQAQA